MRFVKMQASEQNVILDSITEGLFTVDLDFRITSFNRTTENITGIPRAQAIGRQCKNVGGTGLEPVASCV